MSGFFLGEKFCSFADLDAKVNVYQRERFVQLNRRDSRTLATAGKRTPKRVEGANSALVYYSIHFACVFGGKKYKNEGTGQRIRQR